MKTQPVTHLNHCGATRDSPCLCRRGTELQLAAGQSSRLQGRHHVRLVARGDRCQRRMGRVAAVPNAPEPLWRRESRPVLAAQPLD